MRDLMVAKFLLVFLLIEAKGAVIDRIVQVTEGHPARLATITEVTNVKKVILEKNGAVVLRHCFPEEEKNGCKNISLSRFSLQINGNNVTLDILDVNRSDADRYTLTVFGGVTEIEKFTISVKPLKSNSGTEPPIATSTKPTDTSSNIIALAVSIPLAIVLLVVVLLVICCERKKKIINTENEEKLLPATNSDPRPEEHSHLGTG